MLSPVSCGLNLRPKPPAISDRIYQDFSRYFELSLKILIDFAAYITKFQRQKYLSAAQRKDRVFSLPQAERIVATSILMPTPMLEEIAMRRKYSPLAPEGLARITASAKARIFSAILSAPKEALPTPA